jgi:Cu-Zn family superoxide dismutase
MEHTTARISLMADSPRSFDAARGALIVHAGRDDQRTDPSGGSGARIACALFGAPASGRRIAP